MKVEIIKKYIFDKERYEKDCGDDADNFTWWVDVIDEVFYIEDESQISTQGDIYSEYKYIIAPEWCIEVD